MTKPLFREHTHIKHTRCPWCKWPHDRATNATNHHTSPVNGDVSLCIHCGEFAIFDNKVKFGLRKPTDAEFDEIAGSDDIRKARIGWLATIGNR